MTKNIWLAATAVIVVGAIFCVWRYANAPGYSGTAAPVYQFTGGFMIGSAYATIVNYDGNGFSPSSVSIPKGGAVIFRNISSKPMRVASDPYPKDNGYPTKNGCVGSTFDSCDNIPPKVSWSFTFDIPGSWGYHNELDPSQNGMIKIQ